ncbi:caspase family protein [Winogradskyella sp.]|uniref:caspase family protein n=2 Tax=Winogradskyella sp. TaxID=1883156 RepID=UPI00351625E9
MKYKHLFLILLFCFSSSHLFSQNNFIEIDESIYTSAISNNNKTLAVASKKSVYLIDVKTMTVLKSIEVIEDRKSKSAISKLEFHNNDDTLHIKTFILEDLEYRYDNEDYLKDKNYIYDLSTHAISQTYSGLELKNNNVHAFNKLKKEIAFYNPEGNYMELNEDFKLSINDTLLTDSKYEEWKYMLDYMNNSEEGIIGLKDDKKIKVDGKIRHIAISDDESKVAIVYFDSIVENNNTYKIEIRNATTLDLIAEKKHETTRVIDEVKFVEQDNYLALFELKLPLNYYKKQSKTSIYFENFRRDLKIKFLDTNSLKEPTKLDDVDDKDYLIEGNSYWVVEDDNIVNYEYASDKVLNYINTLDFSFHRTRGFYKISQSECLIVGSAEDEYDKDYITKNGVLKYSLEDTKLYNEVTDYKEVDTLYTTNVPFIQNNSFSGNKIQFSGNKEIFMSSINSEKVFQLWSVESRKKLHDIDLKTASKAYLDNNGDTVLIFSRLENLDNGFLLRSLDVNSGVLKSKQYVVRDGKTPFSAHFFYNYKGSKWVGIAENEIWELDTENLTYNLLSQEDFNSGYVYNYHFLGSTGNKIFFKGNSGSDNSKIEIEGVWSFDFVSNTLKKIDEFTGKKNVFQFADNKLITYDNNSYSIYDLEALEIIAQENLESKFIYNVVSGKYKSYVLLGDGKQYSNGIKVLEYDNASNTLLKRFELDIRYYNYSDFNNFFAINDGLVYYDDGQLKLYNSDLEFTANWQGLSDKKYVSSFNLGVEGSLILDGVINLNLKSLELNEIELDAGIHDVAQFHLSPFDDNSQLMFVRSFGFDDNNGKSYIQCRLVKNNLTKDVIWASNKINDKEINSFTNVIISKDKNYAILYKDSYLNHYYVLDIEKQNLSKRKLPFKDRFVSDRNFVIGNSRLFLFDSGDINKLDAKLKTYVYDIVTGQLITTIKDIQVSDVLPDGRLLYINWEEEDSYGKFYLGKLENQKITEEFKYNSFGLGTYLYDNSKDIIIGTLHNELLFWKPDEKTPFNSIKVSDKGINGLKLFGDKLYLLLWDGSIKVIDLNKFEEILNIEILEKNNIIKPVFFTPEGYFKAAKENIRSYHFVKGKDAFSLLTYELFLNRPDVILERLGFSNKTITNVYKDAYLKRLKRHNLNENSDYFSLKRPSIELLNRNEIKSITEEDALKLDIKKSEAIETLYVYINGVPVHESNSENRNVMSQLQLNSGLNRISIIGVDKNGLESDPIAIEVNSTKEVEEPKIYYVGIGVSNYLDESMNLRFADVDVRSISELLSEKFKGRVEIDTLNNAKATKSNILSIKDKLKTTTVNDIVIVSFSGHGLVDEEKAFYFATHDIDFNNPSEKGMSYDNIQSLLDDIPARKKILLIDACHSGELDVSTDSSTSLASTNVNSYIPEGAKGSKGSKVRSTTSGKDSFELMQTLFYDLDRGNGSFVISAAGGKEFAFESDNWGNGVFTYSFLKAINELSRSSYPEDGKINISELKNYIYKNVTRLTNNQQKPTSRAENLEWDWVLE